MQEILQQRKVVLTMAIGFGLFMHYLMLDVVMPLFPNIPQWSNLIKFVLTGGLLYSLIVLIPLYLYDHLIWKWLKPQFNVSGTWNVALYKLWDVNPDHVKTAGMSAITPYREILLQNNGQALIRQTPFRVWVQEASGLSAVSLEAGIATWSAEVVCVDLPGKMKVVFESSLSGGDFCGRDALTVIKRDWRGRPTVMEGDAYHVVKHLDIVLKGAIRYTRLEKPIGLR